ncbi:CU044_2847 family protein [Actinomadura scrupuli]|uniref:CU044_2847 family protein n=1 Tax=Actinomadura scrupuli TaxID=559629 RepID=UPI003D97B248
MSYLFEVPVEGANPVIVEVDEEDDGIVRAARPGEVVGKATETLQSAWARIGPMARSFAEQIDDELPGSPDQVSVEFGFKLAGEAGFVVAKATSEANFKVSFTWNRS